MTNEKPTFLTNATWVPLGASLLAVTTLVGTPLALYAWLDSQFDEVRESQLVIQADLAVVKSDMSKMGEVLTDRLTRSDFDTWLSLFEAQNPGQKVPRLGR